MRNSAVLTGSMLTSEKTGPARRDCPRVWLLLDDRPGHQTQVMGLANSLGWPHEVRRLAFNRLNKLPNSLLGAGLASMDQSASDRLGPPYPDLVIAMGRRSIPISRWIKRASGGRSRLVQLGRKGVTNPGEFSLLVSCAHFNFPPHPRRMEVILPPTQVTVDQLLKAKQRWRGLLHGKPKPCTVFLVGGETAHHRFSPDLAATLALQVEAAALAIGGSLTVVTSPRTSKGAVAAMRKAVDRSEIHAWEPGQRENPYLGYLASADILVVTGESESMIAEAAATSKPLHIVAIPLKPATLKRRLVNAITAPSRGTIAAAGRKLVNLGWLTPSRDVEKMHRQMYSRGLARPFEASLCLEPPAQINGLSDVVERIQSLFREAELGGAAF